MVWCPSIWKIYWLTLILGVLFVLPAIALAKRESNFLHCCFDKLHSYSLLQLHTMIDGHNNRDDAIYGSSAHTYPELSANGCQVNWVKGDNDHLLLSHFFTSITLGTFISLQSHWENSYAAALCLLEFPRPALPFPVCLPSTSQHCNGSNWNDWRHSAYSGQWWHIFLNRSPSVFCLSIGSINHRILSHRLQSLCSISGTILLWFESCHDGRTRTVTINGQS